MKVFLNTPCMRQYKKLPQDIQRKFNERVDLLLENPRNPLLRIHKLKGKKKPLKSMNITGDYRALFIQKGKHLVIFYRVGTHSQLY